MKFLNEDGLQYLVERLVELFAQQAQVNIVSSIDDQSTNQQIAGAKAVYELLTDALAGIVKVRLEVVDDLPATGESNVIYLVEADSNTYQQYIYTSGMWYDLGTTDVDLSGYWAKSDLQAMTNQDVQDIIDEVMGV